jgi:hypothetical protein
MTPKTPEDEYKLRRLSLFYLPNPPIASAFLGLNILLSILHTACIHVFLLGPRFTRDRLLLSLPVIICRVCHSSDGCVDNAPFQHQPKWNEAAAIRRWNNNGFGRGKERPISHTNTKPKCNYLKHKPMSTQYYNSYQCSYSCAVKISQSDNSRQPKRSM